MRAHFEQSKFPKEILKHPIIKSTSLWIDACQIAPFFPLCSSLVFSTTHTPLFCCLDQTKLLPPIPAVKHSSSTLTQSIQNTLTASYTQLAGMHADMLQNTSYVAQEKEWLLNTVSEQSLSTPALRLWQLSQCHGWYEDSGAVMNSSDLLEHQ